MADRCVITIGNFDGVHLGHRAMLRRARDLGVKHGVPLKVLTFEPHPATVLRPGSETPRLSTSTEKLALLREAGAQDIVMMKPTPQLLSLEPQAFVKQLVDEYRPIAMVEGFNFYFGHNRAGDVHTLQTLGKEHGFDVQIIAPVEVVLDDQLITPVSSSMVRWLLGHGRVSDAARCLGRAYSLTGHVIHGEQRGKKIGVPTANLDPAALQGRIIPGDGVYAGTVQLASGVTHPAAISVGVKPTFGKHGLTVEAHLLDCSQNLYDQPMTISFRQWVRDQMAFPDVDALKAQLQRDIAQTRRWHEMGLLADSVWAQRPAAAG